MHKYILTILLAVLAVHCMAQSKARQVSGKILDATTKEPLIGASLIDANMHSAITDAYGRFSIVTTSNKLTISFTGFDTQELIIPASNNLIVSLYPSTNQLQQVIVSSNKTTEKRSEAPIAIAVINKQVIDDAKAQRLDNLLNKVSGVFMVNLGGNEQHQMSIRQPMTTKSLFLYMEDGIPIRTTGVYNHNALLEMNITAAKSIEVIKGPASALYGGEAIGGSVNILTQAAPATMGGNVSIQANNAGYKRVDAQVGNTFNKLGVLISGYYADKKNGPIDYSNFHKSAISLRTDYTINAKTVWTNTIAYVNYYANMTGALDSSKFAQKNYATPHTFTYRSVDALRVKSMFSHSWSSNSQTNFTLLYRNNSVKQNPSYSVASTSNPALFKGQINDNSFQTFALFAQHVQKLPWLNSKLVAGASYESSPQNYYAKFIWINKNLASGQYTSYTSPTPDSLLSKYKTAIGNFATFANYEINPLKNLKIVAALRYDAFKYDFQNSLPVTASSGTPSTVTTFNRVTPKVGFTYNIKNIGFYGNYSEGYVPPQITELFNSTKVPYLLPQTFVNYELGGWISIIKNKLYIDYSFYLLNGSNEIISVKQPDNSFINQNAGKTRHIGVEYGIKYRPSGQWLIRFSGTNAKHTFTENIVKGVDFSGMEMSGAPRFTCNGEIMYKPAFIKGFRIGVEWQHQGKYFMDDFNKFSYAGFNVINCRSGYQTNHIDIWLNVLNAFNTYYSTFASKNATSSGNSSYSYNLGDTREITLGIAYRFGGK
jgi:outer membrane receptor protein involved in Fe transport